MEKRFITDKDPNTILNRGHSADMNQIDDLSIVLAKTAPSGFKQLTTRYVKCIHPALGHKYSSLDFYQVHEFLSTASSR